MTMKAERLETFSPGIPLNLDPDTGEVIPNVYSDQPGDSPDVVLTKLMQTVAAEAGIDFRAALRRVMANPRFEREVAAYNLYANPGHRLVSFDHPVQNDNPLKGRNGADEKVKELAERHMRQKGERSFSKAVEAVLRENPELKAEYAACVGKYG